MEIGYIDYIKKNVTNTVNDNGISKDVIEELSNNMEIPSGEVLKLCEFALSH